MLKKYEIYSVNFVLLTTNALWCIDMLNYDMLLCWLFKYIYVYIVFHILFVLQHGGERFKLLAKDGNEIDSLFIDRRRKENYPNGNVLVRFYEVYNIFSGI